MTKGNSTSNDLAVEAWEVLLRAYQDFHSVVSPAYDEVFFEVSERVRASTSVGKADIGALLFWKRLRAETRWVRDLMAMRDAEVRLVTANAVAAVNYTSRGVPAAASAGRAALSSLPGFARGDALASALLTAAAPGHMALDDRRAQKGLEVLRLSLSAARGRYGRYMQIVGDLSSAAKQHGRDWSAREVDLALYWLGGRV